MEIKLKSGSRILFDGFTFYALNTEDTMHKIIRLIITAIALPFFTCGGALYNTGACATKAIFLGNKKGALEHAVFALAEGILSLGGYYLSIPIALASAYQSDLILQAHKRLTGEDYIPPAIVTTEPPETKDLNEGVVVVHPVATEEDPPILLAAAARLYAVLGLGGSTSQDQGSSGTA